MTTPSVAPDERPPGATDDATRVLAPAWPASAEPGETATVISSHAAMRTGGGSTLSPGLPAGGPQAGPLPAGSRLAEFEVTNLVGQGGFGIVYEAWDHALERVVAIKEYLPSSLASRQADGTVAPLSERHRDTFELGMRSFINEARLLARFDHPSLLKVYHFWQERGTTYMVMPLYRGDTLRQALAGFPGGAEEGWLLRIMDGVTQALAVMHGVQCYHRDIAPDNIILLEGSGRPVVLDFGAARRVITDKTQAITVILKPGYAPIEQYAEMPNMAQGAWTDVYSLAAVMHVAVCGRLPPPSVARLLTDSYAPLVQDPGLRQHYSQRLLAAIDCGLAVRPQARPQSMAALRAALGLDNAQEAPPARQGAALPAARPGDPAPASRQPASGEGASRRRVPAATLAALATVMLAAGAGSWWMLHEPDTIRAAAPSPTPSAASPAAPPPTQPPPAAARVTPAQSLSSLASAAAPGFGVVAAPSKAEVVVGKDRLAFEVTSSRDGFLYVYLLSSEGELLLLFPNLLDRHNRVTAGVPVSLPRASWPMEAGGPPGVNRFVALVSEHEREFGATGIQQDGVFPQFPVSVLAALETARGNGPPPLLGKPVCKSAAPCSDMYGVATFEIVERK